MHFIPKLTSLALDMSFTMQFNLQWCPQFCVQGAFEELNSHNDSLRCIWSAIDINLIYHKGLQLDNHGGSIFIEILEMFWLLFLRLLLNIHTFSSLEW